MPAKTVVERVEAHRIRNRKKRAEQGEGEPLTDDEAARLEHHESTKKNGKSASERIVNLAIEERAMAEGDHVHPDAYASVARAEGLRADTLLRIVAQSLIQVNDQYMQLNKHLLKRSIMLEDRHIALLAAVEQNYLGRTEAEAEAFLEKKRTELAEMMKANGNSEMGEALMMLKFFQDAKANKGKKKRKRRKKKPTQAEP